MPRYQLKNDGTGDKVQILRWTLTTVHSFALIQANTAGWEGGLQGKNFLNITTARKRGHARLIFSLLAQPGSIQIWKKSSEIYQIEQVIMSEKRRREIWKIFSNSSEVSGQKLCFFSGLLSLSCPRATSLSQSPGSALISWTDRLLQLSS